MSPLLLLLVLQFYKEGFSVLGGSDPRAGFQLKPMNHVIIMLFLLLLRQKGTEALQFGVQSHGGSRREELGGQF